MHIISPLAPDFQLHAPSPRYIVSRAGLQNKERVWVVSKCAGLARYAQASAPSDAAVALSGHWPSKNGLPVAASFTGLWLPPLLC